MAIKESELSVTEAAKTKLVQEMAGSAQHELYNVLAKNQLLGSISVTGSALAMGAIAFGAYAAYQAFKDAYDKQDYILAHGNSVAWWEYNSAYFTAFLDMKSHYTSELKSNIASVELPFPPCWLTEEDEPHRLIEPVSREALLRQYTKSIEPNGENIALYGYAQSISDKLLSSLRQQNVVNFLKRNPQRHPYTLFVKELLHWAHTELLHYHPSSSWALAQLQKRKQYIERCIATPNLIPKGALKYKKGSDVTDTVLDCDYPYQAITNVLTSIEQAITTFSNCQRNIEFKQSLISILQHMNTALREIILGQYQMLAPVLAYPPDLKNILKENRYDMIGRHYQSLLHKQIRAFCEVMGVTSLSRFSITFDEGGIVEVLQYTLEAIKIEQVQSNGDIISGLDPKVFTQAQQKEFCQSQREMLIDLAKWLLLQQACTDFTELQEFRGEQWVTANISGLQLLKRIQLLITETQKNLREHSQQLFGSFYGKYHQLPMPNDKQIAQKQTASNAMATIQKMFTGIDDGFGVINRYAAQAGEREQKMRALEHKLHKSIRYLSTFFQLPQESVLTAPNHGRDSSTEQQASFQPADEIDRLNAKVQQALQNLRWVELKQMANLAAEALQFPSTLAACKALIDLRQVTRNSQGQHIIGYCFKWYMLETGAAQAEHVAAQGTDVSGHGLSTNHLTSLTQTQEQLHAITLTKKVIYYFVNVLGKDQEKLRQLYDCNYYDRLIHDTVQIISNITDDQQLDVQLPKNSAFPTNKISVKAACVKFLSIVVAHYEHHYKIKEKALFEQIVMVNSDKISKEYQKLQQEQQELKTTKEQFEEQRRDWLQTQANFSLKCRRQSEQLAKDMQTRDALGDVATSIKNKVSDLKKANQALARTEKKLKRANQVSQKLKDIREKRKQNRELSAGIRQELTEIESEHKQLSLNIEALQKEHNDAYELLHDCSQTIHELIVEVLDKDVKIDKLELRIVALELDMIQMAFRNLALRERQLDRATHQKGSAAAELPAEAQAAQASLVTRKELIEQLTQITPRTTALIARHAQYFSVKTLQDIKAELDKNSQVLNERIEQILSDRREILDRGRTQFNNLWIPHLVLNYFYRDDEKRQRHLRNLLTQSSHNVFFFITRATAGTGYV